jgi:hypothetical protein
MVLRTGFPDSTPDAARPATAGNEALTSWTGLLLLPLLGLVGLTGVAFGSLWRAHFVVGILLVPVIGMKLATTTYRAARYYAGSKKYRAAGPPELSARLLAPVLIAVTVIAMWSGIVMWFNNTQDRPWSTIHTDAVVVMGGLVGIHVLLYIPKAVRAVLRDLSHVRRGRRPTALRISVVTAVLVVGIIVGFATQPSAAFPVHQHGDRASIGSDR